MVRAQTVYAVGGYAIPDFASPDPIGSSTPNSGVFTTLAASGAVTGVGFTARFSAPGPIGDVTPSTGAFTTLSATNFSTTKSTADVEGPSVTNTSTNAAAAAAYSAFNSAGDYVICSVLSTNAALTDQFGPGYGVVYSLKKMCLSSSDNGVFINVNGGTLVGTFTSTGLKIAGSINSRGGDNVSATNSAFGEGALDSNSGGTNCTAVGNDALTANTNGTDNTAVGYQAGAAITGGDFNVAVGANALNQITGGICNVAVGYNALSSATGVASNNVAVGQGNGVTLTTGSNNTLIGNYADTIAAASNSTAIGNGATCTASNQVVIGNSSVTEVTTAGNLQILSGTAVPAGGTAGAGLRFSTTANLGVFFGSGAPSLAAAKGSLYLRIDGSTTNNRMYTNTDGGTTWTALITAA